MRRVKPFEYPFSSNEANGAYKRWGCNCGPTALAAMLGLKPDDVHPHIPNFDERRYTNPSMMQAALRSLGVSWHELDDHSDREKQSEWVALPSYGLVRIQWEGPWLKPGVPVAARYRYTHWIGSAIDPRTGLWLFDCNCGWTNLADWLVEVVEPITSEIKRATGKWHPTHRWELEIQP